MREVTISPKTAFSIIKCLAGYEGNEPARLIHLLAREALGDIKAEERPLRGAVAPIDILAALLGCDSTVEGVAHSVRDKVRTLDMYEKDLAYHRNSFKQIAGMLGLNPDTTPAYIVEQVGVQLKHNGTTATLAQRAANAAAATANDPEITISDLKAKLVDANEQCDKWHGIAMKGEQKLVTIRGFIDKARGTSTPNIEGVFANIEGVLNNGN